MMATLNVPRAAAPWLACALLTIAPAASAQGPIGGFSANLPVPTSPAFAALDISPDKVTRPASPNEFASSLINGVDKDGVLQQGIAIDVAPYMTWAGSHIARKDYVDNRAIRFFSRIQTSLATVKAAGDSDKSTRLSFGTAVTLFDKGDPRADEELANCIASANRAALASRPPVPPPPPGVPLEDFEAQIEKIEQEREKSFRNTCREDARQHLWNRSAAVVGVAPTWISTSGNFKNLDLDGASVWGAVAYGFENVPGLSSTAQVIGFVEYRGSGTASGNEARKAQTSTGGRLRFGSGSTALSLEGVRITATDESKSGWSFTASGERKLTDALWLTLSIGGKSRPGSDGSQTFVLNALSWRYVQK